MIAPEYPRPSMYREHWRSLEGRWEFDFFDDYPITDAVHRVSGTLGMTIEVPFTYQCERSGIGDHTYHPCMVYRRRVKLTEQELMQRIILHFGAVDYEAGIWIDGQCIGTHTGGTPRSPSTSPPSSMAMSSSSPSRRSIPSPSNSRGASRAGVTRSPAGIPLFGDLAAGLAGIRPRHLHHLLQRLR